MIKALTQTHWRLVNCDMPTILLIRHGQSQSNAGLPTSRPEDIELTDEGWQQARDIAQFLKRSPLIPEFIVMSPYKRAMQTAEPTRSLFPSIPTTKAWPVYEFNYASLWSTVKSTVAERRVYIEGYWDHSDPTFKDGPGSESFEQFIKRVQGVIKDINRTRHETIAIFSHQQFICALLWLSQSEMSGLHPETMKEYKEFLRLNPVPNGGIVSVRFQNNQTQWQHKLITSHLSNLQSTSV
jgi:broad specificity phosphatase PhoE